MLICHLFSYKNVLFSSTEEFSYLYCRNLMGNFNNYTLKGKRGKDEIPIHLAGDGQNREISKGDGRNHLMFKSKGRF